MRSASVKKKTHLGATATRDRARQRNAGIDGPENEIEVATSGLAPRGDPAQPSPFPRPRQEEPEHKEKDNRAITAHDSATLPIQKSRAKLSLYVRTYIETVLHAAASARERGIVQTSASAVVRERNVLHASALVPGAFGDSFHKEASLKLQNIRTYVLV